MKQETGLSMLKKALHKKKKGGFVTGMKKSGKKKRKSFGQGPAKDPKGAKPMKDSQLDMKTWKPPIKSAPQIKPNNTPPLKPGARYAKRKKEMCKKKHNHTKMCRY